MAAAAATTLVWVQVKPNVENIITARNKFEADYKREDAAKKKALKELADTKTKLEGTEKDLVETKAARTKAEELATRLENQAKDLNNQLVKAQDDIKSKSQELAAWTATSLTPDQVKSTVAELKTQKDANFALEAEKKVLIRRVRSLEVEIARYTGTNDVEVPLTPGTKGKILVVDPKWDFVVLDIGANAELKPNGVLVVSRAGKFIGKVKVTAVHSDRSIANVMPGSKLQELLEGDQVFY
ncbi:MAG: hypothetical protein HYR88_05640 [Verrucomicrobia bacterium]|nr:hypothetical protein [Verrucomicrobiota bacterium]MBI3868349.1 hypothetical protein [Verrucomicrobiota bacterium]